MSTVMPGMSNALPRMTLAVLRPIPGSATSSSSVCGSTPSCFSTTAAAQPDQRVGLVPEEAGAVDHPPPARRGRPARSRARWGSAANSAGVTELTSLSVLCADRMVATASSSGVVKSSSQCASGWVAASVRSIRPTRRARPERGLAGRRPAWRAGPRCVPSRWAPRRSDAAGAGVAPRVDVLRERRSRCEAYGRRPTPRAAPERSAARRHAACPLGSRNRIGMPACRPPAATSPAAVREHLAAT